MDGAIMDQLKDEAYRVEIQMCSFLGPNATATKLLTKKFCSFRFLPSEPHP